MVGLLRRVEVEPVDYPDYFDLRARLDGLPELPADKWDSKSGRNPSDIRFLCVHQMGTSFGTSKDRREYWRARLASGELSEETWELYSGDGAVFPTRRAQHERMCRQPYHFASLLNGDFLQLNDSLMHTYHGNRANRDSVALAFEGSFPGREKKRRSRHDKVDIEMVEFALDKTLSLLVAQGIRIEWLTFHRNYKHPKRAPDPGEGIAKAIIPAAEKRGLKVNWKFKRGGMPVPIEWDPRSKFNWRGERLGR